MALLRIPAPAYLVPPLEQIRGQGTPIVAMTVSQF